jgi:hypothetical protein
MKMLRRVLVLGGIATPHVAARQTEPQMQPGIAGFEAFLATFLTAMRNLDLTQMCAAFGHV